MVRGYDEISFLEMSHVLRIWADMRDELPGAVPAFGTTIAFESVTPSSPVMREAYNRNYLFVYLPGPVVTYAHRGNFSGVKDKLSETFSVDLDVLIRADGGVEFRSYRFMNWTSDAVHRQDHGRRKRMNFRQWLGADALRIGRHDPQGRWEGVAITREMLIRRIANKHGGSHPAGSDSGSLDNRFDPLVDEAMKHSVGNLPLPYMILLKIAQDLLEIVPRLLAK